jgi:hypothetical protein
VKPGTKAGQGFDGHLTGQNDGVTVLQKEFDNPFEFVTEIVKRLGIVDQEQAWATLLDGRGVLGQTPHFFGEFACADEGEGYAHGMLPNLLDNRPQQMRLTHAAGPHEDERTTRAMPQMRSIEAGLIRRLVSGVDLECFEAKGMHKRTALPKFPPVR